MCNYKITFSRVCEANRIDNLFWTGSNSCCYFRIVQTYMNVVVWEFLLEFYGQVLISTATFASWIGYFPIGIYLCQGSWLDDIYIEEKKNFCFLNSYYCHYVIWDFLYWLFGKFKIILPYDTLLPFLYLNFFLQWR